MLGSVPLNVTAISSHHPSGAPGKATVNLIGNGAQFKALDPATKGVWQNIYGKKGIARSNSGQHCQLASVSSQFDPASKRLQLRGPVPIRPTSGVCKNRLCLRNASRIVVQQQCCRLELEFADIQVHRVAIY